MSKRIIKLTEQDIHRMVESSVKKILKETYNQYADSDFGSTGDPYGFFDDEEEEEDNLDGHYGSFNNIWVDIKNDGKPNAYIMVASKTKKRKQAFEGESAQTILNKIKAENQGSGALLAAIYRNLYKYVS